MAQYSFKMPDVGEGIVEVEINQWRVSAGDTIDIDQPVADVMTDKANVEVTSPVKGKVLKIACSAGEMLAVGAELVLIERENGREPDTAEPESESDVDSAEKPVPAEPENEGQTEPAEKSQESTAEGALTQSVVNTVKPVSIPTRAAGQTLMASPAVRRRAREAEVDLSKVPTTDSSGRITHQDLNAHIATLGELAIGGVRNVRTAIHQVPLKGLRRVIAKKMHLSKRSIPHYSYVEEVDMTDLEKLRKHLNKNRSENQRRLTLLPFLMLAMVRAARKFPECNAHFDDGDNVLTQYDGVHIGMATMTGEGLKVPVVRHVEAMDIWHCASEISRLSDSARDNSIPLAELSGSTITLTSLGTLGGLASTPIINHPEVSIVGVNKAQDKVVVRDGDMTIRYMMNLSSSFDHRIVDGHTGASFIQHMRSLLEHPATLFM